MNKNLRTETTESYGFGSLNDFLFTLPDAGHVAAHDQLPLFNVNGLIRLRWVALSILIGLALLNQLHLHYVDPPAMLGVLAVLVLLLFSNLFYLWADNRSHLKIPSSLLLQIAMDMIFLTALLHYSGGIENPMAFVYVLHIIICSILFNRRVALWAVAFSTLLFAALAYGEASGALHHTTIGVFPHFEEDETLAHASYNLSYVNTRVGLHFLFMALSALFVSTLISRLRLTMSNLSGERQKLRHLIQSSGIGLATITLGGEPEIANPGDAIWTGIGEGNEDAVWRKWIREIQQQPERLDAQKYCSTPSGEGRHYLIALSSPEEHESFITILISDITERKRIEAEIRHADRISILGKVAAGIAHEVGNPLASISTRLTLLTDCEDLAELRQGLAPLEEQVARIRRIVRGVSQIARPKQGSWSRFDLRKAVNDTLNVIKLHRLFKNTEIAFHLPDSPVWIDGVEDQIEQVFLNLCLNALEAMPHGGELRIDCERDDGRWIVRVADTGAGMSEEHCGRIFDLFFTTKVNGLGIGMHIVYLVIKAHDGDITVESEIGKGSTFTITLPEGADAVKPQTI